MLHSRRGAPIRFRALSFAVILAMNLFLPRPNSETLRAADAPTENSADQKKDDDPAEAARRRARMLAGLGNADHKAEKSNGGSTPRTLMPAVVTRAMRASRSGLRSGVQGMLSGGGMAMPA